MDAGFDLYDLNRIYNSDYNYALPKKLIESFMTGESFGRKVAYTPDQDCKLRVELNHIFVKACEHSRNSPEIVMTAGAPGAGKTTLMESLLENERANGSDFTYICPDSVFLKQMNATYHQSIREGMSGQDAYDLWRPASNFGCHAALANLIRDKKAIFFGTTSTGAPSASYASFLKNQGYKIKYIHVSAPDDVRWGSIQERDKTFVQTTEADVREKGDLLPQRINDTFLAFADEIEFYYRDAVKANAVLAAKWVRQKEGHVLSIFSPEKYEKIKQIHNAVAKRLGKEDLLWENSVEAKSVMIEHYPSNTNPLRGRGIIK